MSGHLIIEIIFTVNDTNNHKVQRSVEKSNFLFNE